MSTDGSTAATGRGADAGRAQRRAVPRRDLARFDPNARRVDPLAVLARQDLARVPELVPIRYGRMSASPFAFFRGQAAVMAADLATTPTTELRTQVCGDAHLANFGIFATPERRLVFDVNDFDETLPGPFEWDLKRLTASFVLGARERGFDRDTGTEAVRSAVRSYRDTIRQRAADRILDVWNAGVSGDQLLAAVDTAVAEGELARRVATRTRDAIARARRRTSDQAAAKLTEVVDGVVRFREDPPILSRDALPPERRALTGTFLAAYRDTLGTGQRLLDRFELVDVARRVVGVGSVGTRAYVALLHGRDADDPLILQIKEAVPSVLEAHVGDADVPPARRVVEGQRTMQAATDRFLGWLRAVGPDGVERHFYVRQFRDMKGGFDLDRSWPDGLVAYAGLCGRVLADAHARGGDAAAISAYLGGGDRADEALVSFATTYADLTERDHADLLTAIDAGRITAERGV